MKITNHANLPDAVVTLVSGGQREPVPDSISVTTLIKPPQMVALERANWSLLEEDAADRVWASYGTLMHLALERAAGANTLSEEKLAIEVAGWTVHGTPDMYEEDGTLTDYKFASVWSFLDGVKEDYVSQLNCYAYLLEQHGFPVNKLEIVALYRDWQKRRAHEAANNPGDKYPQQQVERRAVPLWDAETQLAFIQSRVRLHQEAAVGIGDLVPCTDDERWFTGNKWAITKKGNKRAAKLASSQYEATQWVAQHSGDFVITLRLGENRRCDEFCQVSKYCGQFAAMKQTEPEGDDAGD